jgi:SAM-dependent methyltransferase
MEGKVARDEATVAYFDDHVPEYSNERLEPASRFVRSHAAPESTLIDVGCGTGNTLEYLVAETGIRRVAGLDISANCLEKTAARLPCETHLGSILDRELADEIGPRFDFAVVAAVLHHLIGSTRRESRRYAELAVANSKRLLQPGGHLIVLEPVYSPYPAMTALFYVKKGVSRFTHRRVPVLGYWNNIGPPVVSYYTTDRLKEIVKAGEPGVLVDEHVDESSPPRPLRRLIGRAVTTLMVRKSAV